MHLPSRPLLAGPVSLGEAAPGSGDLCPAWHGTVVYLHATVPLLSSANGM